MRTLVPSFIGSACILWLSACSGDSGNGPNPAPSQRCDPTFVGDQGQPMSIAVGIRGSDFTFHELADGAAVPLEAPPQGGHVLFVTVRAKNFNPCSTRLVARLKSPRTQLYAAEERRPLEFVDRKSVPGWAITDLNDLAGSANIPACPDVQAESIVDLPYQLEMTLTDSAGRTATSISQIVPRCQQSVDEARGYCQCSCEANFTLSKCTDLGPYLDGGSSSGDGGSSSSGDAQPNP